MNARVFSGVTIISNKFPYTEKSNAHLFESIRASHSYLFAFTSTGFGAILERKRRENDPFTKHVVISHMFTYTDRGFNAYNRHQWKFSARSGPIRFNFASAHRS